MSFQETIEAGYKAACLLLFVVVVVAILIG